MAYLLKTRPTPRPPQRGNTSPCGPALPQCAPAVLVSSLALFPTGPLGQTESAAPQYPPSGLMLDTGHSQLGKDKLPHSTRDE